MQKQQNTEKPVIEAKTAQKTNETNESEQKERETTTINKGLFLRFYKEQRIKTTVCKKVGIAPYTFYDWMKNDPEFKQSIYKIDEDRNDMVEDILMGLIFAEHDGPSVRYYLDRRDGRYKPKSEMENHLIPEKSLKKLIDEDEDDLNKEPNKDANQNKQPDSADKPGTGGEGVSDKKQEGASGAVQEQPGAGNLLEKKDEEKPVAKTQAEGIK